MSIDDCFFVVTKLGRQTFCAAAKLLGGTCIRRILISTGSPNEGLEKPFEKLSKTREL